MSADAVAAWLLVEGLPRVTAVLVAALVLARLAGRKRPEARAAVLTAGLAAALALPLASLAPRWSVEVPGVAELGRAWEELAGGVATGASPGESPGASPRVSPRVSHRGPRAEPTARGAREAEPPVEDRRHRGGGLARLSGTERAPAPRAHGGRREGPSPLDRALDPSLEDAVVARSATEDTVHAGLPSQVDLASLAEPSSLPEPAPLAEPEPLAEPAPLADLAFFAEPAVLAEPASLAEAASLSGRALLPEPLSRQPVPGRPAAASRRAARPADALLADNSGDAAARGTAGRSPLAGALVGLRAPSAGELLLGLWLGGAALSALRLLLGLRRARSLARLQAPPDAWPADDLARDLGIARAVRVAASAEVAAPMTFGWLRPVVVVPVAACDWPAELRRTALVHELVHVRRGDWFALVLARAACALWWFHPLAWMVARRARSARELACDAGVLSRGIPASTYAGHLLAIARDVATRTRAVPAALSMVQRSHLEERIMFLHDSPASRRGSALASAVLLVSMASLAALAASARPVAQRASTQEPVPAPAPEPPPAPAREPRHEPAPEPAHALAAAGAPAAEEEGVLGGTWTLRVHAGEARLQLSARGPWGHMNSTLDLTASERRSMAKQLVPPRLVLALARDPGGFALEGECTRDSGSGTFTFTANDAFSEWLRGEGFGAPSVDQLLVLATQNAGYARVADLRRRSGPLGVEDLIDWFVAAEPRAAGAAPASPAPDRPAEPGPARSRPLTVDDVVRLANQGCDPRRVRALLAEGLSVDELLRYAAHDADVDEVRALRAAGLSGDLGSLSQAASCGVTPELVEALLRAGTKDVTVDELLRLAQYGVDEEYVLELVAAGLSSLSVDDLVTLSNYGVDAEYVAEMKDVGWERLTCQDLVQLSQYDVDPQLARALFEQGYAPSVDDVTMMAQYGVDGDYVRELADAGLRGLPPADLARLAQYGVDGEYVRALVAAGLGGLGVEDVVKLSQYGVDPEWVHELRRAGLGDLDTGDLVRLSQYGVEPELVRGLAEAGHTEVSVADLVTLSQYGIDAEWVVELARVGWSRLPASDLVRLWNAGVDAEWLRELGLARGAASEETPAAPGESSDFLGRKRGGLH